MSLLLGTITFDCTDARIVADFWAAALGTEADPDATTEAAQLTADRWILTFAAVPEPKSSKNRVHLDLVADDLDAEIARLERLGARVEAEYTDDGRWSTMSDVEGNEFCVVAG